MASRWRARLLSRARLGTLHEELARQGVEETREGFIVKATPLTLDDFKSRLWDPPIHDDRVALERVLDMVWDD